jgi:hypothetical protein
MPRSAARPTRVAFLYIAQRHQVLHSLSAAVALARARPDVGVDVVASCQAVLDHARALVHRLGGAPLGWRLLGPAWLRGLPYINGAPPKAPLLAAAARDLAGYDVIVTPERTTALLRRFGVESRLVYTQHGAGDRAGPFEPRLAAFDLVFAAGRKQRDRMLSEGLVRPERCAVVGYAKFELVDRLAAPAPELFDRRRPTVFYNPHFSKTLGSWAHWGRPILEWFAAQDRFNLIFAPHVRLFGGRAAEARPELAPFTRRPQIHIDLGASDMAFDMTYACAADLYLGDVSSQVYEFIRRPRPCVFLNPGRVEWRNDESFRHWRLGPVIENLQRLDSVLDRAMAGAVDYLPAQREAFRQTFDLEGSPARRAAAAIEGLLPPTPAAECPMLRSGRNDFVEESRGRTRS